MRRVQDEIVAPHLDRLGGELLLGFLGPARGVALEVGVEHVLVAEALGLDVGGLPRLEVAVVGGDHGDRHAGLRAEDRLLRDRAECVGEGLLVAQEEHLRVDEARAGGECGGVGLEEIRDLVLDGDRERIDLDGAAPDAVGHRRVMDGREFDRLHHRRGVGAGLCNGLARDTSDFVGGEVAGGGEAPGAAHEHPHAEPEGLVVADVGDALLAGADVLRARAGDARVGVFGTGGLGGVDRTEHELLVRGVALEDMRLRGDGARERGGESDGGGSGRGLLEELPT